MRKALAALNAVVFVAGLFAGYGAWTRRGAPDFSRGGVFAAPGAPTPGPSAVATGSGARRAEPPRQGSPRAAAVPDAHAGPGTAARAEAVLPPAPGTYAYAGTGGERVDFGPVDCAWDIEDVGLVVGRDGRDVVLDWTWSESRQERGIFAYRDDGLFHTFTGSAVTCVGIRKTEETSYRPAPMRIAFPLRVGDRWSDEATTEKRHERIEGRVLRREQVEVPAGRFDAFVVRMRTEFSGEQRGTFESTLWFAPRLGLWVKEQTDASIDASGALFTADFSMVLAAIP